MAGDRQFYLKRAYEKAFGTFDEANWDPERGFAHNEARILKLYDYYRDTYLARPDIFVWAGLGRMAGAAVVGGARLMLTIGSENALTKAIVRIGKEIFHDLAWQHEAILDDTTNALKLAAERDAASQVTRSYREAWTHILSGDEGRRGTGGRMLVENEQFTIVQPSYDSLANGPEGGLLGAARSMKAFTNSIHPYHRDFLVSIPKGDIVNKDDRGKWIFETGGMWEKWGEKRGVAAAPIVMSRAERTRLVSLSIDKIIGRQFAPVDPTLLPPGAFDSEG
jgi:hypothetical protein